MLHYQSQIASFFIDSNLNKDEIEGPLRLQGRMLPIIRSFPTLTMLPGQFYHLR